MKDIAVICFTVIGNLILYLIFGSVVLCKRKGPEEGSRGASVPIRLIVGFFAYYTVFFLVCVPVMKFYRPLSLLAHIWLCVVTAMGITALLLNFRALKKVPAVMARALEWIKQNPLILAGFVILIGVQIVLVSCTYNFTLDAAYYVAGVSTNVETDMINVYDPFTGAWQDHFEMRYFFATYSVQDAVVCFLTGISPLILTKSVMAVVIIILTNLVYGLIAGELVRTGITGTKAAAPGDEAPALTQAEQKEGSKREALLILAVMTVIFFINVTFNTIYTSSVFLMTRTYEGKAIVGNLAVMAVFYMFIRMNEAAPSAVCTLTRPWLSVFLICFGASTISSTANMLMPVELTVLFLPLIIRTGRYRWLPKYVLCVIPGLALALSFVLYVKGYFVFYTYPR
ncbi:MAG TPA: hypothetical protein DCL38_10030 [Lachnospiraceae bacterium]|nr:hypothetical protein [Lachnospiraceae bacterium]